MTGSLHLPARWKPVLLFGVLAGLVVAVEHSVVPRLVFRVPPALLAAAVGVDVLVLLPGLFYALVVRRLGWPLSTLAAAGAAGLAVCYWLLPAGGPLLTWAGGLAPLFEALTLGYTGLQLRKVRRAYQAARQQSPHVVENLHAACQPALGRLAPLVATEAAVLRYALLGFWAAPEVGAGEQAFSTYRTSGFGALLATLGGLTVVEGVAAHLVVRHWHPTLAWGLTAASAYTLLWLLAHGQAVRCRPVLLTATTLVVRAGFCWRAAVPVAHIASLRPLAAAPAARPGLLDAARLLLTPPNVLLTLTEPRVVHGLFGRQRVVRQLAFYVDEPATLGQQLAAGRA